jgi:RNA polymerase sigma-70 factor (ECF subfamily)
LAEVYEAYFSKIYNYIFYKVLHKQVAEDLTSKVFLKVAEHFNSYDIDKGAISTWLFKIADNTLTDHFRTHRVPVNVDDLADSNALAVDFEGEAKLINEDNLRSLYAALTKLGDTTRDIIVQKYFQNKIIKDIAKDKGMNESTVSTMHNRGLERLRKEMGRELMYA